MNTLTRVNDDTPVDAGPITVLRTQLEQRAAEFAMVLPSHITPEKLQRTILTAVQSNPDLLKADRRSFLTACMKAAHDGSLPDGHEATIVVFNTRMKVDGEWRWVKLAQYMPMVAGIIKKILQSGEIKDIYAGVVYQQEIDAGRFIHEEGSEHTLRHKPIYDRDFRPVDDDIVLAYSVATFADKTQSYEVMRRYEIDEVRESSQTGAQFDAKGDPRDAKGPWVDWFSEMAKKSVLRRHSKSLPQSSDIIADVEATDMAFASRSALALLESAKADKPMPALPAAIEPVLEDGTFDDETGEEIEPKAEPEPKPKRTRQPAEKPKQEAEPEPEPEPAAEPEPDDPGTDELGVTKSEFEDRANDYIDRARAAELLVDLRRVERDAEDDLEQMPVDIAACVDTEFDKARKRLTPPRKNM